MEGTGFRGERRRAAPAHGEGAPEALLRGHQHPWDETTYWVCTLSINQHAVKAELGSGDPLDSSFYLAMRSEGCRGTAMVIDSDGWPLTRSWCLFEVSLGSVWGASSALKGPSGRSDESGPKSEGGVAKTRPDPASQVSGLVGNRCNLWKHARKTLAGAIWE